MENKITDFLQFTGYNHKECEDFCKGHFDPRQNYPHIIDKDGKYKMVRSSHYLIKYEDGTIDIMIASVFDNESKIRLKELLKKGEE